MVRSTCTMHVQELAVSSWRHVRRVTSSFSDLFRCTLAARFLFIYFFFFLAVDRCLEGFFIRFQRDFRLYVLSLLLQGTSEFHLCDE